MSRELLLLVYEYGDARARGDTYAATVLRTAIETRLVPTGDSPPRVTAKPGCGFPYCGGKDCACLPAERK